MLSKAICIRCWNEINPNYPWDKYDEDWWGNGYVWCIKGESSRYWVFIDGEPPKDCIYFLEQTLYSMSQEKQDVE